MALGVVNECTSCEFFSQFEGALNGVGKILFDGMSGPVSSVLVGFMIVFLLFHIQIRQFLGIMNSEMDQTNIMQEIYANSGRLAVVGMTIASYPFWHDWVVGSLNLVILGIANIVMSALDSDVLDGAVISGKTIAGNNLNNPFTNQEEAQFEVFSDLLDRVYHASYTPLTKLFDAMAATEWTFTGALVNGPAMFKVAMSTLILGVYAAVSNTLFMIILLLHRIMTELVAGLGPLVMALWVFKATKPYAYAAIKMLLATGSSVIAASFLMSLSLSVVANSLNKAQIIVNDGATTGIDEARLNAFVFSSEFIALENAYLLMMFMMILAAIISVTTLLSQKPNLEKI